MPLIIAGRLPVRTGAIAHGKARSSPCLLIDDEQPERFVVPVEPEESYEPLAASESDDNALLRAYVNQLLAIKPPSRRIRGAVAKHFSKRLRDYLLDARDDAERNFK